MFFSVDHAASRPSAVQEAWRDGLLNVLTFSILGTLFFQTRSMIWTSVLVLLALITVLIRRDTRLAMYRLFLFSGEHAPDMRWISWPFLFWFIGAMLIWLSASNEYAGSFPIRALRFFAALSLLGLALAVRPRSHWLFWSLVAASVVASAFGIHGWVFHGATRVSGADGNPVTFGIFSMLIALLLVLFSALSTQMHARWRIGLLILAAFTGAASSLSGTRSSILALAVLGGMLLFLRKDRFHRRLLGLGIAGLMLGAILMMGSGSLREKMRVSEAMRDLAHAEGGNYQNSLGTRFVLWGVGWDLFKKNPWTGVGRDGYQQELTHAVEKGEVPRTDRMHNHAHSDGLNAMATGGIVGLLSYLGIIVGPLVFFGRALYRAGSDAHQRIHAAAGMLVVGAFFCFGLVNTNMDRPIPGLIYPLLICALAAQLLPSTRKTGKEARA